MKAEKLKTMLLAISDEMRNHVNKYMKNDWDKIKYPSYSQKVLILNRLEKLEDVIKGILDEDMLDN